MGAVGRGSFGAFLGGARPSFDRSTAGEDK
jgi:hypothetical protein